MADGEVLRQSYWFGYSRLKKSISGKRKDHEMILNTKLKQVCYSIEIYTLQLFCKISARNNINYITDMLCDRNMDIYADFFFLICMQNILNDL